MDWQDVGILLFTAAVLGAYCYLEPHNNSCAGCAGCTTVLIVAALLWVGIFRLVSAIL